MSVRTMTEEEIRKDNEKAKQARVLRMSFRDFWPRRNEATTATAHIVIRGVLRSWIKELRELRP